MKYTQLGHDYHWDHKSATKLLSDSGLKTSWVADKCGISSTWLRLILNGKKTPSLAVAKVLALTLGVSPERLIKAS